MVSLFLVYNVPFFLALAPALSHSMTETSEPSLSSLYPMSLPDRPYRLDSILNLMTRHDHVFLLALPHKQEICSWENNRIELFPLYEERATAESFLLIMTVSREMRVEQKVMTSPRLRVKKFKAKTKTNDEDAERIKEGGIR